MANVFSISDAQKANIITIEDDRGTQAVHDLIVAMHANRRSGTAQAKTRGEVSDTGKKPFRQKGTGRARQGGDASPVHRGGGVVFGPRNRDYSKKVPKKVRKLAFAKALTERIKDQDVLSVDSFAVADGKTKNFLKAVKDLTGEARKVMIVGQFDEPTFRAGRNVKNVLLMSGEELNAEHLLYYDKIVLTGTALAVLASRTEGVLAKKEIEEEEAA